MGKRYCAFLRGVNVKGTAMKMDKLKAAFEEMGFSDVKTLLATGNVIFNFGDVLAPKELKDRIEKGLGDYFQYDANVFIRDSVEVEAVLTAGKTLTVPEDCHHYVLVCDEQEITEEIRGLFDTIPHEPQEQFALVSGIAFWIVPKGSTLSSQFGSKVLGSRKYKSKLTSRNFNTMEKVYAAMGGFR